MTDTLFSDGTVAGNGGGTAQDATLGVKVSVSVPAQLGAVRFYSGAFGQDDADGLPQVIALFTADDQVLVHSESASWSGAAESGWVRAAFTSPPSLSSGTAYMAAVLNGAAAGSDWYLYDAAYWTTGAGSGGVTSGALTAPGGAGSQGWYNLGSSLAFPATLFDGANWWIDVEVSETPPAFEATFVSTDGNGVQTWTATSALNGPSASTLRILPPTSGSGSYAHSFLFMLPVSTGTDATFGDPLTVMEDLGACNAYNTTAVVPSFPIQPWYADNPGNTQQSQESFMLALAAWMSTSSFASGGEKNYLIGFSKSGIGGQGLQFRRPDVWAACASWDAPFMMTDYDGTDPTYGSAVGGDPEDCYGTSANFTTNYELTSAHLASWAPGGSFTTEARLWVGGYYSFQADVSAYMTRLASAGILFNGAHDTLDASHAWHDDWVSDALAAIMAMPAMEPGAALSGSGTLTVGAVVQFTSSAALDGSGTLTAVGTVSGLAQGSAALSGSGAIAAAASLVLAQAAALSGSGTVTAAALVAVPAAAALSGTGLLLSAVTVTLPASAALAGTGTIAAAVTVASPTGAALSGAGVMTAGLFLTVAAAAVLGGLGTLTVSAQVITPVTEPSVAWSVTPCAPRWTCTPRGRLSLPLFSPIAAVSLECVNVLWLSDLDGTSVDPTGQTTGQPQLPVYFAFPPTSGNYAEPAQPVTWFAASWLLGGTGRGFVSQCLVGPGGGVVTLTAGQQYDVWGRVVGNPESPEKFAGVLSAF
jgi:hypothetical protein